MSCGGMGGMALGWIVVSLFFLGLLVAGVVLVVRSVTGSGGQDTSRQSTALSVLEERYARGDIGAEEFEERRRTLLG